MLYRLVRPMKRKGSQNLQYVKRIPRDIADRLMGRELSLPVGDEHVPFRVTDKTTLIRVSLRTADATEVKIRQARLEEFTERYFQALREDRPAQFSHREAVGFSKRVYEAWVDEEEDASRRLGITGLAGKRGFDPGRMAADPVYAGNAYKTEAESLAQLLKRNDSAAMEALFGRTIDRQLMKEGVPELDPFSRQAVACEIVRAAQQASEVKARQYLKGDYSPDPQANRFPAFVSPKTKRAVKVTLTGLVDLWWAEAKGANRTESTLEGYRRSFTLLSTFLKHNDALKVTEDDVVAFKNHRLKAINPRTNKPISAKTVGDTDLSALKSVFAWAVKNKLAPFNPAKDVSVMKGPRRQRLRDPGLSHDEAVAILSASNAVEFAVKNTKFAAAKRWVPWIMAYSGARVGEICQLRKEDIAQKDGHWVMTITPEAGTVKNKHARDVVLHAHLLEQGFLRFVEDAPDGHLFLKIRKNGEVRGPLRTVKNDLADFARAYVKDPNVAPNHGWRHRFKTIGREVGIADSVLDGIEGHLPHDVAGNYGTVSLKAQVEAMAKIPRIALGGHTRETTPK